MRVIFGAIMFTENGSAKQTSKQVRRSLHSKNRRNVRDSLQTYPISQPNRSNPFSPGNCDIINLTRFFSIFPGFVKNASDILSSSSSYQQCFHQIGSSHWWSHFHSTYQPQINGGVLEFLYFSDDRNIFRRDSYLGQGKNNLRYLQFSRSCCLFVFLEKN